MTLASESPLRRALYRALHDPLTGLANRGLLMDQLGQAVAAPVPASRKVRTPQSRVVGNAHPG